MAAIQDSIVMGKKNKMLLSTLYIAFSNTSYFTSVITNFSLPGKITQMLVYPRGWQIFSPKEPESKYFSLLWTNSLCDRSAKAATNITEVN